MKKLTDLLHENQMLKEQVRQAEARAEEWRERYRTLDNAFYSYRTQYDASTERR